MKRPAALFGWLAFFLGISGIRTAIALLLFELPSAFRFPLSTSAFHFPLSEFQCPNPDTHLPDIFPTLALRMATDLHTTALLLFVRDEREEAQLKPLVSNQRASAALFRRFNAHARQQAQRTGLPLFVVKGGQQRGHSFGERLANAIESVFARGYERVISLGNDCLQLQPQHLMQAAQQLQQHDLVLGPAADGGVYLLGVSQSVYDRQAFLALPWQTQKLAAALKHYTSHCLLPDLAEDIDDWQDFQRQLGRMLSYLRKQFLSILAISKPACADLPPTPTTLFLASVGLRAPPY